MAAPAAPAHAFTPPTSGTFGNPPPPAPPPASMDTNYFFKEKTGQPEEVPAVKKGPSPGTSFLQRYATPNEIVNKAATLAGVGGALIALPDGLLVAAKIPADMNADTLAAFLPQIFGRVSQSTRELRMGDLNNLNFTVGLVPWKIFRVGAIYFAAFGVAGQPLPGAQLAGIAAELDRKK
jgi:predicted regulator of Ras-like GTPase activity (Roadblock/LC7/MglB family)